MTTALCRCGHRRGRHYRGVGVCLVSGCACACWRPTYRRREPAASKPATRVKEKDKRAIRRGGGSIWPLRRDQALRAAGFRCVVCSRPIGSSSREPWEVAHRHPLGRGRSRHSEHARCSLCGCRLNDPGNLAAVCHSTLPWPPGQNQSCHDVIDAEWRAAGRCRRKEHDDDGDNG